MTTQIIAWIDNPEWTQQVRLDNVSYILTARYNYVFSYWALDILDASSTMIVSGIKIVKGMSLISQHIDPRLPPGAFLVEGLGPTDYDGMLRNTNLLYIPVADLIEILESI